MLFIVFLMDLPHDILGPLFHLKQYGHTLHHKIQFHLYFSQLLLNEESTLETSD